jgi:hypothetical protein
MPVKKTPSHMIIRKGEEYVYAGSIPKKLQKLTRELKHESGRKVVFVAGTGEMLRAYVSKKFYADMCKTKHPWHGKGTLI